MPKATMTNAHWKFDTIQVSAWTITGRTTFMRPTLENRLRRLATTRPELRDEFNDLANQLDEAEVGSCEKFGLWLHAVARWKEVTGEHHV